MSSFVNDVKFVSTTAGTGAFTVPGAAVSGFQLPAVAAGFSAVATYSYSARNHEGQFESGIGVCNGSTLLRTTIYDGSSGPGVTVNFTNFPTVIMTVLASDLSAVPVPAGENKTFYVAPTTGSNSNSGTSVGSPFLTVQKALDTAATFDYQNLYTVTINVADGTNASGILLPPLINYPSEQFSDLTGNITTPSNVVISSASTDAIRNMPFSSTWRVRGFRPKSTSGTDCDIIAEYYCQMTIDKIDFAGSGTLCCATNHATILAIDATLSISSTAFINGFKAFFYGSIINDDAPTTITNACTVSNAFVACGDHSIMGNGTFVNSGNVTGDSFTLFNFGVWELDINRGFLPGGGGVLFQDDTGDYAGDPYKIKYDGSGNARLQPTGALYFGDSIVNITPFGSPNLAQIVQATPHEAVGSFTVMIARFDDSANDKAGINFLRSRNSNPGSFTAVSNGDDLGVIGFWADGGADYNNLPAFILVQVDAAIATASVPGRVIINTCSAGSQFASERSRWDSNGNFVHGTAAISTTATDGFLYIPTCAGPPTGTPSTYAGRSPIVIDSTDNRLYFYSSGSWRNAGP